MELRVKPETEVKFNLTDDQIKLMNMLLINGWQIKTPVNDLLKGKLRFRKKNIQVLFNYINIYVIDKNGFFVFRGISLDDFLKGQSIVILK